jgi:hypothetical protein
MTLDDNVGWEHIEQEGANFKSTEPQEIDAAFAQLGKDLFTSTLR